MADFETHVHRVMARQHAGRIVGKAYGQTLNGQRFALVKTQVVWFAVRLIMEGSYAVEREEFYWVDYADAYILNRKKELEM
uniref:Cystatin domain-containing protein n=1 Tax=Panagrellus redivivus TaxID=6233 RepID=A0A7E4VBC0_PANRE